MVLVYDSVLLVLPIAGPGQAPGGIKVVIRVVSANKKGPDLAEVRPGCEAGSGETWASAGGGLPNWQGGLTLCVRHDHHPELLLQSLQAFDLAPI